MVVIVYVEPEILTQLHNIVFWYPKLSPGKRGKIKAELNVPNVAPLINTFPQLPQNYLLGLNNEIDFIWMYSLFRYRI